MDKYKIKQVTKACRETSRIIESCIKQLPNFKTESQVRYFLNKEARKHNHKLAFKTIVASAKNASNPHYSKCKSKLKKGFLVIDFGIRINGYCSDMTRTVYLGKPSKKERLLYNKVLKVQLKSIELLRKKCINVAGKYAKRILGKEFIHSLGHGVGKRIHEKPTISFKNNEKIKNGTCFTVEPGVYRKKKYGIRIEDTLIKSNGRLKLLTPFSKKLVVIYNNIYK